MSELTTIKDLLEEEIKDLYSAEKQLTKAIPKMAKGSNNEELSGAFEAHLKETENQVKRLEKVAELLGTEPTGKKCKGMEGVIDEGSEALDEDGDECVLDLGIIGAGSRVEHYEIAGYTTAISLATKLGEDEVVKLLSESLKEEQAAEDKLRAIADTIIDSAPRMRKKKRANRNPGQNQKAQKHNGVGSLGRGSLLRSLANLVCANTAKLRV